MSKLKVAIAVVGISNSGKSTTLFDVATILENQGFPVCPSMTVNKKIDTRRIVVIDGVTIAICPPGDDIKNVERNFDFADQKGASILVYAQHAGNQMLRVVSEQQKNKNCWLVIKYKDKMVSATESEINIANQKFAGEIVNQVIYLAKSIGNLSVFPY